MKRKLCGKLHLKAETQQIDRILVEFANRYWDCNPSCIFGNSGTFYKIKQRQRQPTHDVVIVIVVVVIFIYLNKKKKPPTKR